MYNPLCREDYTHKNSTKNTYNKKQLYIRIIFSQNMTYLAFFRLLLRPSPISLAKADRVFA